MSLRPTCNLEGQPHLLNDLMPPHLPRRSGNDPHVQALEHAKASRSSSSSSSYDGNAYSIPPSKHQHAAFLISCLLFTMKRTVAQESCRPRGGPATSVCTTYHVPIDMHSRRKIHSPIHSRASDGFKKSCRVRRGACIHEWCQDDEGTCPLPPHDFYTPCSQETLLLLPTST